MQAGSAEQGFAENAGPLCFVTLVRSAPGWQRTRRLVDSLRTFGGTLKASPVWVFTTVAEQINDTSLPAGVEVLPLALAEPVDRYYFGDKVSACAQAEAMALRRGVPVLVWMNSAGLIVNPPDQFVLDDDCEAALRPVHIQNVGLRRGQPLDVFWAGAYRAAGLVDMPHTVESFVDTQVLRPYFNSHLFAIRPQWGVLQAWYERFGELVADQEFQESACQDELHQVFLHQAIFSALLVKMLAWDRLRWLPPSYSYPLHLHRQVPENRRPARLNDLVCAVYEDAYRYPEIFNGLAVEGDLQKWLARRG